MGRWLLTAAIDMGTPEGTRDSRDRGLDGPLGFTFLGFLRVLSSEPEVLSMARFFTVSRRSACALRTVVHSSVDQP